MIYYRNAPYYSSVLRTIAPFDKGAIVRWVRRVEVLPKCGPSRMVVRLVILELVLASWPPCHGVEELCPEASHVLLHLPSICYSAVSKQSYSRVRPS